LFEEPVSQGNISEMAQVRRHVRIPIATCERLFMKLPFYRLIKAESVDVLRPDICNAGGITELKKVAAIAEALLWRETCGRSTPWVETPMRFR
jgi:L-alanine-DL-glutamate epimerase-like enolase superfamily enzyme